MISVLLFAIIADIAAQALDSSEPTLIKQRRSTKTEDVRTPPIPTTFDRHQWGLNNADWKRYQSLMQGIRGSISPANLSPIEVLGVHARSDEERLRYARKWRDMMRADTTRVLAFQKAYDLAWREIDSAGEIIDMDTLAMARKQRAQATIESSDRLLVFLRLNNCPNCAPLIERAQRAARRADAQLDIYFTDTRTGTDDRHIQQWVLEQSFKQSRIQRGRVTFNHDQGTLTRVAGISATSPRVLRLRGERIEPLDWKRL